VFIRKGSFNADVQGFPNISNVFSIRGAARKDWKPQAGLLSSWARRAVPFARPLLQASSGVAGGFAGNFTNA
jgi:hypothetical protein